MAAINHDTCGAAVEIILNAVMLMPTEEAWKVIANEFLDKMAISKSHLVLWMGKTLQ